MALSVSLVLFLLIAMFLLLRKGRLGTTSQVRLTEPESRSLRANSSVQETR